MNILHHDGCNTTVTISTKTNKGKEICVANLYNTYSILTILGERTSVFGFSFSVSLEKHKLEMFVRKKPIYLKETQTLETGWGYTERMNILTACVHCLKV